MTHELKHIIGEALIKQQAGHISVLATVVALDGSSYRKPGVRMLVSSDGSITGAISGGCVEKEVQRRAQSVFNDGRPKMITYDGRYRLGCEGVLYILLEPFLVSDGLKQGFDKQLVQREDFRIRSYFKKGDENPGDFGSTIIFGKQHFWVSPASARAENAENEVFEQTLKPSFRLFLIGAEHDAVKLCTMAANLGWEVEVVSSVKDPKSTVNFPGAKAVHASTPEQFSFGDLDAETAVVLMTHNYATDLAYLLKLVNTPVAYLGILGATQRREQLFNALLERCPEIDEMFLDRIYSPAGLNLGAVTAAEIALSILSEILSLTRKKEPFPLREIMGNIHS